MGNITHTLGCSSPLPHSTKGVLPDASFCLCGTPPPTTACCMPVHKPLAGEDPRKGMIHNPVVCPDTAPCNALRPPHAMPSYNHILYLHTAPCSALIQPSAMPLYSLVLSLRETRAMLSHSPLMCPHTIPCYALIPTQLYQTPTTPPQKLITCVTADALSGLFRSWPLWFSSPRPV